MTPKEEALRIYNRFQIYEWHEVDGFVPNDKATLENSINVVKEICFFVYNIGTNNDMEAYQNRQSTLRHLANVIEELKKI